MWCWLHVGLGIDILINKRRPEQQNSERFTEYKPQTFLLFPLSVLLRCCWSWRNYLIHQNSCVAVIDIDAELPRGGALGGDGIWHQETTQIT